MAGVRKALIVATDVYGDPKLARLNAPATDARALAEVLQDPDVGAFEVDQLLNRSCHDVEVALTRFLAAGRRGDTLLLHFSGHGVKDLSGELYFATADTELSLLKVTGVASSMVKEAIEESRASLILCLVDCCYSGAFTKSTKAAATLDLTERLGGQGRAVITASTSLQLALDGQEQPSLFTRVVVEGLRSGEADRDLDGLISLDELYSFVHERVTAENPDQTPVKSFDVQGDVYVARRGNPVTTPAALPRNLLETLATGEVWERRGAVTRLRDLLVAGHPGRALAAKLELERIVDGDDERDRDDSSKVREDAAAALLAAGAQAEAVPEIPAYTEFRDLAAGGTKGPEQAVEEPPPIAEETGPDLPDEPGPTDDGGRRRWVLWAVGVAALLAVALGGYFLLGRGDGAAAPLPESEMLVPVKADDAREFLALDAATGDHRVVVSDGEAFLPTLTQDRRSMYYLKGSAGTEGRVPYLARVDGGGAAPLLADDAREKCPSSGRPSQSLDGEYTALVCRGASESQASIGLFRVDRDGELSSVYERPTVAGAPTWTGDGDIVFMQYADGAGQPSTLWQVPADGSADPKQLTFEGQGWATDPDWSDAGLLFTITTEDGGVGDAYVLAGDGSPRKLTSRGDVAAATWSPDGSRIAFVTSDSNGEMALWTKDAHLHAPAHEIDVDGVKGVAAWGAR